MGFRNPFRIQVDENDVAYVTDYSPDAQVPQRSRGPSGVGRVEIVRKPSNYVYPLCYSSKLGYYRWNFREFAPGTTTVGIPADNPPQPVDCGANPFVNDSRWVRDGAPSVEPGLRNTPPAERFGCLVLLSRQQPDDSARYAVRRRVRNDPWSHRAGLDDRVPAAVPGSVYGRRGAARCHEVPLRGE